MSEGLAQESVSAGGSARGWLFWAGIGLCAWMSAWARSWGCGVTRVTDRGPQGRTGVWRGISEQHSSLHHTPRVQVQRAGVEVKGMDSKSRCEKLKVKVGGLWVQGRGRDSHTTFRTQAPSLPPHGPPPSSCSLPSQLAPWVPPLWVSVRLPFYHTSRQDPHLFLFILQALQGLSLPHESPQGCPASR